MESCKNAIAGISRKARLRRQIRLLVASGEALQDDNKHVEADSLQCGQRRDGVGFTERGSRRISAATGGGRLLHISAVQRVVSEPDLPVPLHAACQSGEC
jgi:hypothetical protein